MQVLVRLLVVLAVLEMLARVLVYWHAQAVAR
jgi:hypothetical protein